MAASVLGEVSRKSQRRLSLYRIATYAYSLIAYLVLALLVVGAGALIYIQPANPFVIVVAIVMLGLAWIVRPRMPEMPEGIVDRTEFAGLYVLTDRISDVLGAHRIDGIVIDNRFNASFGRYGLRGRRVMRLGLPLWSVLEPQELVALIAHEVAHDVNGDPARGLFVGRAYFVLVELVGFFAPQHLGPGLAVGVGRGSAAAMTSLGGRLGNLALAAIGMVVRPFLVLFGVLIQRDSQRAEYLADRLAADVAGRDAAGSLLRKLHLRTTFQNIAKTAAARGEHADVLGDLRRWVADAPPSEWDRIDHVMQMEQTQIDSTHPPTGQRVVFIRGISAQPARLTMTVEERDAIDRELMPLERGYTRALIESARARLYRG